MRLCWQPGNWSEQSSEGVTRLKPYLKASSIFWCHLECRIISSFLAKTFREGKNFSLHMGTVQW